mgnify:CR=1 FL=1
MTNRERYNSINTKLKNREITAEQAMELLGKLYVDVVFDGDGTITPNEIDCNVVKLTILEDSEKMKTKLLDSVDRRRKIW